MKTERTVWERETSTNTMVVDKSSNQKVDVVDLVVTELEVDVADDPITFVLGQWSYFG